MQNFRYNTWVHLGLLVKIITPTQFKMIIRFLYPIRCKNGIIEEIMQTLFSTGINPEKEFIGIVGDTGEQVVMEIEVVLILKSGCFLRS